MNLDGNRERTNGEATTVCERRPETKKKTLNDGWSAGTTIDTGKNRCIGSLPHEILILEPVSTSICFPLSYKEICVSYRRYFHLKASMLDFKGTIFLPCAYPI